MKKSKKLKLHRETLRTLDRPALQNVDGAGNYSFEGGETCCWCTDTCNNCETLRIEIQKL